MKFTAAALLILASFASAETSVKQYEGPTDCSDDEKVTPGSFLEMHYTGTIDESSEVGEKGLKFDSSRDRGQTFDVQIGVAHVIKGWDEGLIGLCKGAKAILVIPPEDGYGDRGAGPDIPGGATLNFDVEVVDISSTPPPEPNFFQEIDTDESGTITREEVEAFFQKNHGTSMPDGLWENEDKDGDGIISWEEFGGSKGDTPPGAEL
mmetsp:Transcript_13274/g.33402  ORF Transcript_13274/g.33402 Transcript_13274/m.33402 type:complete len:207 (-) Transcript_13274:1028-1648(-)